MVIESPNWANVPFLPLNRAWTFFISSSQTSSRARAAVGAATISIARGAIIQLMAIPPRWAIGGPVCGESNSLKNCRLRPVGDGESPRAC